MNVVSCTRCGRDIMPRVLVGPRIFPGRNWTPVPLRSICPFCAATYARFYSPVRDLFARLIVLLALLVLVASAIRLMARVELKEHARSQPRRSLLLPNLSPSAVPRKH